MKKLTLLAAVAAFGLSVANAQGYVTYNTSVNETTEVGAVYHALGMNIAVQEALATAGKTVYNYNVDDTNVFFYDWAGGYAAWETSEPGVDENFDGYTALTVTGTAGWSGGGHYISSSAGGADFSAMSDDTHFHICVRTSNAPSSIGLIIGQGDEGYGWTPADISIGTTAFNDNGTLYPLVGNFDNEGEWVCIDITFAQLKELWPSFTYKPGTFVGNAYAVLSGNVAGVNFAFDGIYFYSPASSSVSNVAKNDVQVIVTDKTIQVLGNNNGGIELYNVAGQRIKSAKTAVIGCENLANGVYIVKAGNVVKKVVLK